jgi:hypothetical protein
VTGIPEKAIFRSETVYSKVLSICNLPVKIEQMQDKTRYSDTGATSMFHFF